MKVICQLFVSRAGCAAFLSLVFVLAWSACGDSNDHGSTGLSFTQPAPLQLSESGPVSVELTLPTAAESETLIVSLDGQPVADELTVAGDVATGVIFVGADGTHRLTAEVQANGMVVHAETSFETVALVNPDECEVLNPGECLLPYPSSRFLAPADTETGYRTSYPPAAIPLHNGIPIDPAPYAKLDGFSPLAQIVMLFPGGVDPVASDAPRLLAETRATDLRSLDPDSPTLIVDWDSGERILHFAEADARAAEEPDRQVLFLRPGLSLTPGRRYIAAVRRLVHRDGTAVAAPSTFAALRDRRATSIAAIESRREHFEELFDRLDRAGVEREDLLLAFDFVVESDESLTGELLAMRDQAFAWLDEQAAAGVRTFAVDDVVERDCALPTTLFGREVYGTFEVPLFLTADPVVERQTPGTLRLDPDGVPASNGFTAAPFTIAIPCAALGEEATPLAPLVRGHGAFDSNRGVIDARVTYDALPPLNLIEGATDWTGFAIIDLAFFASATANLNLLPALTDRGRQGVLNTLVLARMMKDATFNRDAAFQSPDGTGVFAGPAAEMYFAGGSLGGDMAFVFAALSPDVTKVYADVGGIDMLGATADRTAFAPVTFAEDPLEHALLTSLTQQLILRAEGGGYATHVTANPLPGVNAKKVLLTMAWLDQYTPNLATELAARTLQLPSLEGSLQSDLPLIPDLPGPLPSAFVTFDTGAFDLNNPSHASFIPPLANLPAADPVENCQPHDLRVTIPAAAQQLQEFLRPGGAVENFCNGLCDSAEPLELPNGAATPCDPLEG